MNLEQRVLVKITTSNAIKVYQIERVIDPNASKRRAMFVDCEVWFFDCQLPAKYRPAVSVVRIIHADERDFQAFDFSFGVLDLCRRGGLGRLKNLRDLGKQYSATMMRFHRELRQINRMKLMEGTKHGE